MTRWCSAVATAGGLWAAGTAGLWASMPAFATTVTVVAGVLVAALAGDATWRHDDRSRSATLAALGGAWLAFSPWAFGVAATTPVWSVVAAGAVSAVTAAYAAAAGRVAWLPAPGRRTA